MDMTTVGFVRERLPALRGWIGEEVRTILTNVDLEAHRKQKRERKAFDDAKCGMMKIVQTSCPELRE